MERIDSLIILAILVLIEITDIELDSRIAIRAIRNDSPIPGTGAVKHFFEGIVIFWVYVILLAVLVGVFGFPVIDLLSYSLIILAMRLLIHPLYFSFRVVIPIEGWASWGHLGTTSFTDRTFRWLGFSDKNHYIARVIVGLVLVSVFILRSGNLV